MNRENNIKKKRIIAVIGVPRSGTSAITRGLEALGVKLGDCVSDLTREDNEKGFFEDVEINAINTGMLNSVGYRWGNPVSPLFDEDSRKILSVFLPVAKDIVLRRLESTDLFGFKDPMISLLLPLWNEIFDKIGCDASYVIACRNPLSVASSMQKTNKLDILVGCYVWLAGMLSSLIYSGGFKRVVVDYDELMSEPEKQLERISERLDLEFDPESSDFRNYKNDFLSNSLRHTNFNVENLLNNPDVPAKAAELYALLKRIAKDEADIEDASSTATIKKIYSWAGELRSTLLYIQAQSDALFSLREAIEGKNRKIQELNEIIGKKENSQ